MIIRKMQADLIYLTVRNQFKLEHTYQSTRATASGFERRSLPNDIRWVANMQMTDVPRLYASRFEAFYNEVMMGSGFFTMFDPARHVPRGTPYPEFCEDLFRDNTTFDDNLGYAGNDGGAVLANDFDKGSDNFRTINLYGGNRPPVGTALLKEGDHLEIKHNSIPFIYMVTKDVWDTRELIYITPRLRQATPHSTPVRFLRARSVFQFVNADSTRRRNVESPSYTAREVPEVLNMEGIMIEP